MPTLWVVAIQLDSKESCAEQWATKTWHASANVQWIISNSYDVYMVSMECSSKVYLKTENVKCMVAGYKKRLSRTNMCIRVETYEEWWTTVEISPLIYLIINVILKSHTRPTCWFIVCSCLCICENVCVCMCAWDGSSFARRIDQYLWNEKNQKQTAMLLAIRNVAVIYFCSLFPFYRI